MDQKRSFSHQVRELVCRIPRGKVASYGQLALMLGKPRGARAVASVMMNTHDEVVPCHRVVHQDGLLCPSEEFGTIQRLLLESEGVEVEYNRIDMLKHRWRGEDSYECNKR